MPKMNQKIKLLCLIFLITISCYGQDKLPKNPRVGIVLSGGGAKGLAHIGVLKVIDSLGVRIDYIAGTSMGAAVGGLYASGYTAKQLDSIFKIIDFDVLLGDKVPRPSKTFQERKNSEKYAFSVPIDNFKIKLPSSISRGQNLFNLFTKLTLDVSSVSDFSNLPIPFYCMATDMETGDSVILEKGNLAEAILISNTLPTLFQPVENDGRLLMDGGISNNFPIEYLKTKDLDFIIGVSVEDNLLSKDEIKSISEIFTQINNFRSNDDLIKKIKYTDLFIEPNIDNFSIISFNKGDEIIKSGQVEALSFSNQLKSLAKRQNFKKESKIILPLDTLNLNKVKILGNEKYTDSYVFGKLRFRRNGSVSFDDFSTGVNNLLATNNFDSFRYTFNPVSSNSYDLIGNIKEAKNTKLLKLGLHYDQLLKSSILLNLTKKQLLLKNDVLSLDLILGDNTRFNFDYYIDKGFYWSIGFNFKYTGFKYEINPSFFGNIDSSLTYDDIPTRIQDFKASFFVETLITKDISFKIGTTHSNLEIEIPNSMFFNNLQNGLYAIENSKFFSLNTKLKYDTLDSIFFPTSGILFQTSGDLYLSGTNYDNFEQFLILNIQASKAFQINNNLSVLVGSEGGLRVGSDNVSTLNFGLGGYSHNYINNYSTLYGYDFFSLSGDSYFKLHFLADYEFAKRHHLNFISNFSNIGNDIFTNGDWLDLSTFYGYSVGYGLETIFGPIELKYHWSPKNKFDGAFVNVGYWF